MTALSKPGTNHLLAALPDEVWPRWGPMLERVELPANKVLYEAGDTMAFVYFPINAIVSLLYVTRDGECAETALVGNEGVVGVSVFLGGQSTLDRAVVQSAGKAVRIEAQAMIDEFERAGPVRHLLLRYTQALMSQMEQTAVCSRHHTLDRRLCRWLLLSLDRIEGNELLVIQDLIANMLGVRRESVAAGAARLQEAGVIRCSRGRIQVLDRAALEHRACDCYDVIKKEYARLLAPAVPRPHAEAAADMGGAPA